MREIDYKNLAELELEWALDTFEKRYPRLSERKREAVAGWLDRNGKRIKKLIHKGWKYIDILELAYRTTKLNRMYREVVK